MTGKILQELNDKRKATNENLNDFGEYKKSIFENEINKFLYLFSQIKNFKATDNTLDEYEFQNNEISFVDLKSEDYIKIVKKNSTYLLKSSFLDSLLDENNLYIIEKVISK